jgi:hypothetical protein
MVADSVRVIVVVIVSPVVMRVLLAIGVNVKAAHG